MASAETGVELCGFVQCVSYPFTVGKHKVTLVKLTSREDCFCMPHSTVLIRWYLSAETTEEKHSRMDFLHHCRVRQWVKMIAMKQKTIYPGQARQNTIFVFVPELSRCATCRPSDGTLYASGAHPTCPSWPTWLVSTLQGSLQAVSRLGVSLEVEKKGLALTETGQNVLLYCPSLPNANGAVQPGCKVTLHNVWCFPQDNTQSFVGKHSGLCILSIISTCVVTANPSSPADKLTVHPSRYIPHKIIDLHKVVRQWWHLSFLSGQLPVEELAGLHQVDPEFRPQLTDQFVNFPRSPIDGKRRPTSWHDPSHTGPQRDNNDVNDPQRAALLTPSQLVQLTFSSLLFGQECQAGEPVVEAVRILLPDRRRRLAYEAARHAPVSSTPRAGWCRLSWSVWFESGADVHTGFVRCANGHTCQEDHWLNSLEPAADAVRLVGRLTWNHTTCQHHLADLDPSAHDLVTAALTANTDDAGVENRSAPVDLPVRVGDSGLPYPPINSTVVLVNPRLVYSPSVCRERPDLPAYLLGDALVQLEMTTLSTPVVDNDSGYPTHTATVHLTGWGKPSRGNSTSNSSGCCSEPDCFLLPVHFRDVTSGTDRQKQTLSLQLTGTTLPQWLPVLRAHWDYRLTWHQLPTANPGTAEWPVCRLLQVTACSPPSHTVLVSVTRLSSWLRRWQGRGDPQASLSVKGLAIHRHPVDDGWSLWLADCSPLESPSFLPSPSSTQAAAATAVVVLHFRVDSLVELHVPRRLSRLLQWPCPLAVVTVLHVCLNSSGALVATDESSILVNGHLATTGLSDLLRLATCDLDNVGDDWAKMTVCPCSPSPNRDGKLGVACPSPSSGWIRPPDGGWVGDRTEQVFSAMVVVTRCLQFRCFLDPATEAEAAAGVAADATGPAGLSIGMRFLVSDGSGTGLVQLGACCPSQRRHCPTATPLAQTSLDMSQLLFGLDRVSWHRLLGQLTAHLRRRSSDPSVQPAAQLVLEIPGEPTSPLESALVAYLSSPGFLRFHCLSLLQQQQSSVHQRRQPHWRLRSVRLTTPGDRSRMQSVNYLVPPLPCFELLSVLT